MPTTKTNDQAIQPSRFELSNWTKRFLIQAGTLGSMFALFYSYFYMTSSPDEYDFISG